MQFFCGIEAVVSPPRHSVVTIGNFDGVHLGHRQLFTRMVEQAKRTGGASVVITFKPHPQQLLNPASAPKLLNTYEEKLELFAQCGLDVVVEQPFSREFSQTSPEDFFTRALVAKLDAKALYLGHDFGFGKDRTGGAETLGFLCSAHSIETKILEALVLDGRVVSSSLVRECLDKGEVEAANRMLGRDFFIRGLVWRGRERGKQIGFATANLKIETRKLPRLGVYVTQVLWRDKLLPSITNVGKNPTFTGDASENPIVVETHILDFEETIYGDSLELRFKHFLRPEQKFSGVPALVEQISKDVGAARNWHHIR